MARNGRAKVDWPTVGPRALAWLADVAPHRRTHVGLAGECVDALGVAGLTTPLLADWLITGARKEWWRIKGTITANGNGSGIVTAMAGVPSSPARSLAPVGSLRDFVREERLAADRAACPVCRLEATIRRELADDGVTRALKIRYVERKCGVTLTLANLDAHARHQ